MFVDASALCAILLDEPDADRLVSVLDQASVRLTSAIAVFETVRAIMRETGRDPTSVRRIVGRLLDAAEVTFVDIGQAEREAALDAMDRFGKGRHPAALNMGDCFAYACAKTHGASLLFKGADFTKTDIDQAGAA